MRRPSRLGFAVLVAGILAITFSGVAAADTTTGSIAHYVMNDLSTFQAAGATCKYNPRSVGSNTYDIYKISARPPSAWWYDTNSSIDTQHGTVGWQMIVNTRVPPATTWTFWKKTSVQKKVAYEDHPAYDLADRAPFTNLSIDINYLDFAAANTQFQVVVKAIWYHADGSVRGTAKHTVVYYRTYKGSTAGNVLGTQYCSRSFVVFTP
jgi:hypothetical protein